MYIFISNCPSGHPPPGLGHVIVFSTTVCKYSNHIQFRAWWHQEPGTPQGVNGDWCHQHQHQRQHQHTGLGYVIVFSTTVCKYF